ncbi:GDSL esterase/lipase 1 isoform X1 [Ricinus communis]|uniref:Zinc finger protein, putative n=1 Tax=Ricinus communis TaxID=3988 RepID=B9T6Q0_RICCO|nr:GDSL esterase/lipase 1 isoform X1 [Ricinus communis]EEF28461.1 zinc finger protein, putative [Ricinus communis]|eukprot:XP_002533919.1 GDSL esterase/lipase 1 [Ricinus communis]
MVILRSHFYLLVFFASLLISTCSQGHLCYPDSHVALFIFGDSLFDAGNNNYLKDPVGRANFWPYGKTFFKHPTGRCCDGRIIPDFIAEYLKLPFIRPYLEPGNHQFTDGVNFASGGAGVLLETHQGKTIDLKTQLSYFKHVKKQLKQKVGDTETKRLLSTALYLISIGTNDYLSPITANSSLFHLYSKQEYVGMVIGNLTTVLQEIYKTGGRKFGFLSLGAVDCLPGIRALNMKNSGGCMKQVTDLIKLHNKELSVVLKQLESQLQGFKYSNFDFYKSFSERINNPIKYGFKEAKSACCGTGAFRGMGKCGGTEERTVYELCDNPDEYLFFDSHPSEKANYQFAKLLWSGSTMVTRPCNLKEILKFTDAGEIEF